MRIKRLDFLRGIAVILVLFRHFHFSDTLTGVGWIGVDLFFVLSGFLVSGLLFKEYSTYNNIKPWLFFIRRGFKIYPLFYFYLLLTVFTVVALGSLNLKEMPDNFNNRMVHEALFIQNYFSGVWNHTWSLAVEEHFYILLIVVISFLVFCKKVEDRKFINLFFFAILLFILIIRLLNSYWGEFDFRTHMFATHIRIDSLLFGVLLSYNYHFNRQMMSKFFDDQKWLIVTLSVLFLIPPFLVPIEHPLVHTIGFTLLYLGFGCLMMLLLFDTRLKQTLNHAIIVVTVNKISMIGFYSYSIYLFHLYVVRYIIPFANKAVPIAIPEKLQFLIYFALSIGCGYLASIAVEQYFLRMRDRLFPRRVH